MSKSPATQPRCGLCGKTEKKLTRTECCDRWVCDDEDPYVMFSYAHNSCHRNHRRFTLCGHHRAEGHRGRWQDCTPCRESCETEMYVYYGTNEYNFVKLENPPAYEPTRCSACGGTIALAAGGYSVLGREYHCPECTEKGVGFAAQSRGRTRMSRGARAGSADRSKAGAAERVASRARRSSRGGKP